MKKTYTSVQYAQGSLVFFVLALVWIFPPWVGTTSPMGSTTANGFDDPFLGVWMAVALVLGGGAVAGYAFRIVGQSGGKPALAVGLLTCILAVVLGLADQFRDVGVVDHPVMKVRRWYPGPAGVASSALLAAACVGGALARLVKEEDTGAGAGGSPPSAPPPA